MRSSTTPGASSDVSGSVGPSRRWRGIARVVNGALEMILRSPLHGLASHSLALVEFTGRRSGKRYRTPVGYRRDGDIVTFHTPSRWRTNLRDGEPIRLWLRGRAVDAAAEVVTDARQVARAIAPVLERAPLLARFYRMRIEPDGRLNPEDLARLASETTVVNVRVADKIDEREDEMRQQSMVGKIVLITGANSGIGKAAALALARRGATLVMVSRTRAKGELAAEEVIAKSGNPHVELLVADLTSQEAVRRLAHDFLARRDRLDVLINNAGVYMPRRALTVDGLETTLATNYLAPVLLTNLLLPALKAAAPSRIINVSSGAQAMGRIDFNDLRGVRRYRGMRAYSQSKLTLITWSYELARRLSGSGVTVNALEPGFVATKLPGQISPLVALVRPLMISPEQGARTIIMLASSPRAEGYSGNFFSSKGAPIRSARQSYDPAVAQRLWDETARLVGVPAEEFAPAPARRVP